MKKDLIITFATEGVVLLCGLLTYKLANMNMGNTGFAIYALCRRTHSLIFPALAVGSTVAIPRFIAFSSVENERLGDSYFIAGFRLVIVTTIIFIMLTLSFPSTFAKLFFNDPELSTLALPHSLLMIGYACHCLCYAYFRGHSNMKISNILQIINIALIPVAVILFFHTAQKALLVTGLCWLTVSAIVLAFKIFPRLKAGFTPVSFKQLFRFGIQRLPADFGAAALLGLPATLTAHYSGAVNAGYVAFSISLLNMCGAAFKPIGLVLLPKASAAIAKKEWHVLRKYLKSFFLIALILSSVFVLLFELFAKQILTVYLNKNLESGLIMVTKIVMIAAVPYCIYVALRSIVDAFFEKSINAFNILISLTVFFVLASMPRLVAVNFFTPLMSFVVAISILGILTTGTCLMINHQTTETR